MEIDAADQLKQGDAKAITMGVHPTLASLEMLLYPKSAVMITNDVLAVIGVIEVIQLGAQFTLFVWGQKRVCLSA